MQTPISQISSPNATPAPAKREMPSGSAPDGDFQRTLNRQLEQRQATGRAQAQTPVQAAAKPAPPPAPANNKAAEQAAAEQAHASTNKEAAPADKDSESSESDETVTAEAKPPADPIADMLALVGSMSAMQQPAGGDASARALARLDGKIDGKSISAAQLLAGQKAAGTETATGADSVLDDGKAGGFAASLGKAQAGAGTQAGKLDAGKLALDAQLAATAKAGAALAEPLQKEATPDLIRLAAPLAPGALQQAAAAAAVPADKLMGRVGTPAWDQQLGQKVVWMAAGGDQSATLTLNPPDLGPLQVVLTVTNDQADAAFMSAQPEVRQALEAALPRLRDMMAEAGIAFGNATVSDGAAQQQSGQRDASGGGRGASQGGTLTGGEIAITQNSGRGRPTLGEVDTFA